MNANCRISRIRPKSGGAEISILHNPNKGCANVPDMLREMANNIESGRVPVIRMAAVAIHSDGDMSIYGWGDFSDRPSVEFIGMMHLGANEAIRLMDTEA